MEKIWSSNKIIKKNVELWFFGKKLFFYKNWYEKCMNLENLIRRFYFGGKKNLLRRLKIV